MKFRVVIPSRYESQRLPGKPLVHLAGRTMIEHVWRNALECGAYSVHIATDDSRIEAACRDFGAEVCMTSASHASGTDRIAEVARTMQWPDDEIVVNVQGDEPLLPPRTVRQVADLLAAHARADLATLSGPMMSADDFRDPNVVKVVCDRNGNALYFSRAPIPFPRDGSRDGPLPVDMARRHVGLYAYRAGGLRRLAETPPCTLERTESLEQLRALWLGLVIVVADAVQIPGPGVDTHEDVSRVQAMLAGLSKADTSSWSTT